MNKLKIRLCGDLILREKCDLVADITPELRMTLDEMVNIMNGQQGVGLAAPQVGVLQRFLVMTNPDDKQVFKMINPAILVRSEKMRTMEEGCMSLLGNDGLPVYANVSRPESVEVGWTDENGHDMRALMSGYPARIVQHEIDHLDGVLFIDYLSPIRREMLMRKVKRYKK
ncbi:MAG: peptide deformylase [Rickettsiales bacterium]|jgi:peptide deformylase|nr:peptide deformylase [Rickettsiales bacterium]